MRALVWVAEETWEGCVDAAAALLGADADVTVLAVADEGAAAAAAGAVAGLLGRPRRHPPPDEEVAALSRDAAARLLEAAAARLERRLDRVSRALRAGRLEDEVLAASAAHDVLVLARDGERDRRGPHSLGHATRFIVDHAPCAILLVWPGPAPAAGPPIPPAPPPP